MIVIEDINGLVYCISPGETHMASNGSLITYKQVLEWISNGVLQDHGFRAPTIRNEFTHSNGLAARSKKNLMYLAAII